MHKSNEDCFYFLTSSCTKGATCTYRHSPLALTCNVICPSWLRSNCLDPACPFRHSAVQRPMLSNGILCFYENTPTGCLKPECTFIHSRPRVNLRNTPTIRPLSTNLVKNDTTKSIVNNILPTSTPSTMPATDSTSNPPPSTINEAQSVVSTTTNESPSNSDTSLSTVKAEIITRRIAVPSDVEQSNEKKTSSNNNSNNLSLSKSTTRSIITESPKKNQEEIPSSTTTQSRLVVNRNVVLGESTSVPIRTIFQTTPSSNRVVVSSDSIISSSKGKKNNNDVIEQENETKKFKSDSQSTVDIQFPCSTPSVTNRLLLISSKETTSTNNTKPIQFNRDRLPATKPSSGNSLIPVSTPSNEEKISAGTGLSQVDERRTMRLERFQTKPISPSRSITCSSSMTTTSIVTTNSSIARNVVTSSSNERKRTAPETTIKDVLPSKRISAPSLQHKSSPRQTTSSIDVSKNSSSPSRNKNLEKRADESIAKNSERKKSSSTITVPSPSVPSSSSSSSVRPRFVPQLITPPSPLQQPPSSITTTTTKAPRPRPSPPVVIKRPLVPVTAPSQTSTKSIEQVSSNITENNAPPSSKSTVEHPTINTPNEEDENQLLKFNDSADVVDTFALIDEALLEADHLLELM